MQLATHESPSTHVRPSPAPEAPANLKSPEELAGLVAAYVTTSDWLPRVQFRTEDRWYERLHQGPDYDIWAISWMPGQSTGFHDHGDSAGAFVLHSGVLEEHRPGQHPIAFHPGQPRSFARDYAHDVRNASDAPAVSIHAYSPPLTEMNEYELDGAHLIPRHEASERATKLGQE